jgi:MFS family permease
MPVCFIIFSPSSPDFLPMTPTVEETATSLDRSRFSRLCAATLAHFLVMGIFLSALPLFVTDELGGSRAAVGASVGSFFVAALLFRPSIGRGMDRRGRKPFLVGAPLLVLATSLCLIPTTSLGVVVAIRFVQGLAGAAFYTAAATVATDLAPEGRRAEIITLFSLFLYGGLALGPAIGERLADGSFTRVWLVAALAAAVAAGATLSVGETRPVGSVTGHRRFALHPSAIAPGVVLLCAAAGYSAITSFSPLYARTIDLASSEGLYGTFAITIIGVRVAARRMADNLGRTRVAFPGLVAAAAGLASLALFRSELSAYAGVALYGGGFALIFPALMALTVDRTIEAERGEALGSFTAFFDLGAGIGSYAVGWIAGAYGFGWGFGLPCALCIFGATAALRLGRTTPTSTTV